MYRTHTCCIGEDNKGLLERSNFILVSEANENERAYELNEKKILSCVEEILTVLKNNNLTLTQSRYIFKEVLYTIEDENPITI